MLHHEQGTMNMHHVAAAHFRQGAAASTAVARKKFVDYIVMCHGIPRWL
jgi:hypothetical protein